MNNKTTSRASQFRVIQRGGKGIVDKCAPVVSVRNVLHQSLVYRTADPKLHTGRLASFLGHCAQACRALLGKDVSGLVLTAEGSAHSGEYCIKNDVATTTTKYFVIKRNELKNNKKSRFSKKTRIQ